MSTLALDDAGMDVLMDAVRDRLRHALGLGEDECDVCPDGKPNPGSGQRFFSVHSGSVSNSANNRLDERYGVKVTVTVRTSQDPRDRKRDGGCWALALKARNAVHMSYETTTLATTADATVSFVEPLVFKDAAYLGPQGGDWFWAEGHDDDPTGIAIELSFGEARRLRYLEELTVAE